MEEVVCKQKNYLFFGLFHPSKNGLPEMLASPSGSPKEFSFFKILSKTKAIIKKTKTLMFSIIEWMLKVMFGI